MQPGRFSSLSRHQAWLVLQALGLFDLVPGGPRLRSRTYPHDSDAASTSQWLRDLKSDRQLLSDTLIQAEVTDDVLVLMLSDLYQVNNRSLVSVLEEELESKGFHVADFCSREHDAKKRSFAHAASLAAAA